MDITRRELVLLPFGILAAGTVLNAQTRKPQPGRSQAEQFFSLEYIDEIHGFNRIIQAGNESTVPDFSGTNLLTGELEKIADAADALSLGPSPRILSGSENSIQAQFEKLKLEGKIPNLTHLDDALNEIADEMADNPKYLAGKGWKAFITPWDGKIIFTTYGNIEITKGSYKIYASAIGSIKGERFNPERIMEYSASNEHLAKTKLEVERRQTGSFIERWWAPVDIAGISYQRRARISYPGLSPQAREMPDMTGLREKAITGLRNQNILLSKNTNY